MLIPTMAALASRAGSDLEKVAIVVDVREGAFLPEFPRVLPEGAAHAAGSSRS